SAFEERSLSGEPQRLSRRAFVRGGAIALGGGALAAFLVACGGSPAATATTAKPAASTGASAPSSAPAASAAPAASSAPAASAASAASAAPAASSAPSTATGPKPTGPRPDAPLAADSEQILRMVTTSPFRMEPPSYGGDLWQIQ